MANYQLLKADIDKKVYQNGAQEITGANLNSVLNAMVTTLGAEYQFAGVATIDTNPGTPDAKVFYIANGKGTYTKFGSLEVTEDEVVVLYYDTEWHKVATGIASQAKLTELESGYIFKGIINPNINPGTPTTKVFYLTSFAGVYPNLGLTIEQGVWAVLYDSVKGWHVRNVYYDIYPEFKSTQDFAGAIADSLPYIYGAQLQINKTVRCTSFSSLAWDNENLKFVVSTIEGYNGLCIPVLPGHQYNLSAQMHGAHNHLLHIIELSSLPVLNSGEGYIGVYTNGQVTTANTKYLFLTFVYGNDLTITDLTEELATETDVLSQELKNLIGRDKLFLKPVYENNFENNIVGGTVNEISLIKKNESINVNWEFGKLSFPSGGGQSEREPVFVKSPISFYVPNFYCDIDVADDSETIGAVMGSCFGIGLIKDENNYIVGLINKADQQAQILWCINGNVDARNIQYFNVKGPYTVRFTLNGGKCTFLTIKNGVTKVWQEVNVGGVSQWENPSVLSKFKLGFAVWRARNSANTVITALRGGYFGGYSFGADYHIFTYEDGTPIVKDNCLYFTASIHYSALYPNGIVVYKTPIHSFEPEMCGLLYFRETGNPVAFGGQSAKVVYDRTEHTWVVVVTNFKVTPCITYIGKTNQNLLSGYHFVDTQVLNCPDSQNATWDIDLVKIGGVWYCIYANNNYGANKCSATDVLGEWTAVGHTSQSFEGAIIFRCNGKYYFSAVNYSGAGLDIYDFVTLEKVGTLNVTNWCDNNGEAPIPHSWGQIVAISTNNTTEFYLLAFSRRVFNEESYGYGDLWFYKALQKESGSEFDKIFNGIEEISVSKIASGDGISPLDLEFEPYLIRHIGIY